MRNIWNFARREYKLYFISPIAYIVAIAAFVIVGGVFVYEINFAASQSILGGGTPPDASLVVGPLSFVFLFTAPVLTMRLLADEQRMGTMELLLTAPVRDWELVVGKWLGSFLFALTIILATLIFPFVLNKLVSPGIDQGLMLAAYLAIILLVAVYLAIGTAFSAIFTNQFAAFFVTFIVIVIFWYLIRLPTYIVNVDAVNNVFTYLDLNGRFSNMMGGRVALSDVVYPLSLTAFGLFLGSVVVEMRRWQ